MITKLPVNYQVFQKRYQYLINNRTEVFCLIFRISFILNKAYPKLAFEIKIDDAIMLLDIPFPVHVMHIKRIIFKNEIFLG